MQGVFEVPPRCAGGVMSKFEYIHTYIHTYMQGVFEVPPRCAGGVMSKFEYMHTYIHTYIHTYT